VAAVTTAPAVPAAKPAPKSTPGPKSTPAAKPGPAGKGAVVAPVVAPMKEERTSMFANLVSSPPPAKFYPPEADKNKEKGTVNLRVCADGSGTISGTPEVVKSSGSKLLDQAAQTWAKAAKWIPATYNRAPVEGCTQVDVVFEAKA
jgi:TonB family protein